MKFDFLSFRKPFTLSVVAATLLLFVAPPPMQAVSGPTLPAIEQVIEHPNSETISKKEHRKLTRESKRQGKKSLIQVLRSPSDPDAINGFAVAGFVCSLVGLLVAGILLGGLGIIFSAIAMKRIREGRGGLGGRGLAIAGLIIGIVAVIGAIIFVAAAIG